MRNYPRSGGIRPERGLQSCASLVQEECHFEEPHDPNKTLINMSLKPILLSMFIQIFESYDTAIQIYWILTRQQLKQRGHRDSGHAAPVPNSGSPVHSSLHAPAPCLNMTTDATRPPSRNMQGEDFSPGAADDTRRIAVSGARIRDSRNSTPNLRARTPRRCPKDQDRHLARGPRTRKPS